MPHVDQLIDVVDDADVRLVVGEVVVSLDGSDDFVGLVARLELDIDHAAVDARARGDGHRERLVYACDGLDGYGVPHAHPRAEVGIGNSLGHDGLHQRAYDGVATGVPACSDDADGACGASCSAQ